MNLFYLYQGAFSVNRFFLVLQYLQISFSEEIKRIIENHEIKTPTNELIKKNFSGKLFSPSIVTHQFLTEICTHRKYCLHLLIIFTPLTQLLQMQFLVQFNDFCLTKNTEVSINIYTFHKMFILREAKWILLKANILEARLTMSWQTPWRVNTYDGFYILAVTLVKILSSSIWTI